MKSRAILASLTLALFGTVGAFTATAQSQDDSTAKQDIKDAGHDTKKAAKKTGSATKNLRTGVTADASTRCLSGESSSASTAICTGVMRSSS